MAESENREFDNLAQGEGSSAPSESSGGILAGIKEITVKQCLSTAEMLRGTEEPNQYAIHDKSTGDLIFRVIEKEDTCMQQCCGSYRTFDLRIVDKFNREIIQIKRPHISCGLSCLCGLTDCYDKVNVYIRNYKSLKFEWNKVGIVTSYWCPLRPYMKIYDRNGNVSYTIKGPWLCTYGVSTFNIKRAGGGAALSSLSKSYIRKEWSGLCREVISEYDLFSLKFPDGSDQEVKANMLGALFLIDFKYFEGGECCCPC